MTLVQIVLALVSAGLLAVALGLVWLAVDQALAERRRARRKAT